MPSENEAFESSFWSMMVDTHPLTASSRLTLPNVLTRMAAHPAETNCIVALHRRKVVGIATRHDLIRAIAQNPEWQKMPF